MNRSRRNKAPQECLSQPNSIFLEPQPSTSFSQGTQSRQRIHEQSYSQMEQGSPARGTAPEEENQLVNRMIRYIFVMDRSKQVITKARLLKDVLKKGQGKYFHRVMAKVSKIMPEVFGYDFVEIESNKFILVNEIQNDTVHIEFSKAVKAQQVLLLIVLTHIFMQDETCSEALLWAFLEHLGIIKSDNYQHAYFGNVKKLITQDFVVQKYLDVTTLDKDDETKVEYKWGPRAENEFSRRAALEFMSRIYNGRPINSWPLQFKALKALE